MIYQYSTIAALIKSLYDGGLSLSDLLTHGNFGLGTFNALDGELTILDGIAYQARSDGTLHKPPLTTLIPFATICKFDAPTPPNPNLPTAIRIDGHFSAITYRAVPRQTKPYPALDTVAKTQPIFTRTNIEGTIVGFQLPSIFSPLNVPGTHLHFISADRTTGGHVIDHTTTAKPLTQTYTALHIDLPTTPDHLTTDLTGDHAQAIHSAES